MYKFSWVTRNPIEILTKGFCRYMQMVGIVNQKISYSKCMQIELANSTLFVIGHHQWRPLRVVIETRQRREQWTIALNFVCNFVWVLIQPAASITTTRSHPFTKVNQITCKMERDASFKPSISDLNPLLLF